MSKHKPATRDEFKAMVLRKLGAPVIKINVSDDHIEDCIEAALKYYYDYHYDGSEHVYYAINVDQTDINNRYVAVPEEIIGITDVYSLQTSALSISSADMFNNGYMIMLDFAFNMTSGSMVSFYLNKQAYEFINQMIIGQTPIRFSRHLNRVSIDFNWDRMTPGSVLVLDAYKKIDPADNPDVWNDQWLIKYTVAKVKYVWGGILSKFQGMQITGGATIDGTKIQDDAKDELQQLEDEMISTYSIPPRDYVG